MEAACGSQPLFLVEEITHRVLNEYTEAINSLAMAAASATEESARNALVSAAKRLRAQAEVHRALRPPANSGPIDLGAYIGRICASLSLARLAERGVSLTMVQQEAMVDADRCWRAGLIVAELVNNAARHGFARGAGTIKVETGGQLGLAACRVSDNGRSKPNPPAGRGCRLAQELAADLDGRIDWSFSPWGCEARLVFPIDFVPPLYNPQDPIIFTAGVA
jgi:two-component sensor histidine kinase